MLAIGVLATTINKKYVDQLKACRRTWVLDCAKNNVPVCFFGGSHVDVDNPIINLPNTTEDLNGNINKQFLGLRYLYENHPADFYYFVSTETYVVVDQVLAQLKTLESPDLYYIGGHGDLRKIMGKDVYFHSGGSGFILSRALMEKMYHDNFLHESIADLWNKVIQHPETTGLTSYAAQVTIAHIIDTYYPTTKIIKDNRYYACNNYGFMYTDTFKCCRNVDMNNILSCHYMDPTMMDEYYQYLHFVNNKAIDDKWTIVTAFFDLTQYDGVRQENASGRDTYLQQAKFVLSLRVNLVIYCDNVDIAQFFINERKKHQLENYTKILLISLRDCAFYNFYDQIVKNREVIPVADKRNTPLYFVLVSCKFLFLQASMKQAYFEKNTDDKHFYAWLDIGIVRIGGVSAHQIDRILQVYREKCSLTYIDYTDKNIMANLREYYRYGRCGTAAGFITGEKNYLNKLCKLFGEALTEHIEKGFGHAEEQIIPFIYEKNKDLFEFSFGDYATLLCNYDHIRRLPVQILNMFIVKTKNNGAYKLCLQACSKYLQDLTQEFFLIDDNNLCKFLDIMLDVTIHMFDQKEFQHAWQYLQNKNSVEFQRIKEKYQQYDN
jgi:hypothetical protein